MREENTGIKILRIVAAIAIRVVAYVFLALLLVKGVKASYQFGHDIFFASSVEATPGHDKDVSIPKGASIKEIAEILDENELIDNKVSFIVQSKFFELEPKAGHYTLNTSQTSREMLEILDEGTGEEENENE